MLANAFEYITYYNGILLALLFENLNFSYISALRFEKGREDSVITLKI